MKISAAKHSLHGQIHVPGSKSQTIRSVMLATLAEGESVIRNPLPSKDGLASLEAAKAFGAKVEQGENEWRIQGLRNHVSAPSDVVNTMNSGTTTSFVLGIAGLADGYTVVTGDEQIRHRPWKEETDALNELGAEAVHTIPGSKCPPIVVHGPMKGGIAHLQGLSSQYTSGLLIPAALLPEGTVTELHVKTPMETPYVTMTEDFMRRFGAEIDTSDFHHIVVTGGQKYHGTDCTIDADWSSCAFPIVAAACTDGSEVTILDVNFEDSQSDKRVADILTEMGADITKNYENRSITIRGGKKLHGLREIDMNAIPDSLPILCVAACRAEGDTVFTHLENIRLKETDRVVTMHEVLTKCGADIEVLEDRMIVHGGKTLTGTEVPSFGDHRIAMAMSVCGLFAEGKMVIQDAQCAEVSFPKYYGLMNSIGASFGREEA